MPASMLGKENLSENSFTSFHFELESDGCFSLESYYKLLPQTRDIQIKVSYKFSTRKVDR